FDRYILAFDIAGFTQSLPKYGGEDLRRRGATEKADHRRRRLLRARCERPCCQAAEQRDEGAAPHSMTSSARASTEVGTSKPIALAVLRLTTSSYLVGACTGRSAGFSPLRMRST